MKKGVDYIGVTCVFYCHDGLGNLLLHKRSKNCRDEVGMWDCGGGTMRVGETFEQTVRREVREEYGCEILDLVFAGVNNVLRKNNAENTHWVAVLFAAKIDPKRALLGDLEKMDKIGWFSLETLPQPLHSMFKTHLKMIQKVGVI